MSYKRNTPRRRALSAEEIDQRLVSEHRLVTVEQYEAAHGYGGLQVFKKANELRSKPWYTPCPLGWLDHTAEVVRAQDQRRQALLSRPRKAVGA